MTTSVPYAGKDTLGPRAVNPRHFGLGHPKTYQSGYFVKAPEMDVPVSRLRCDARQA